MSRLISLREMGKLHSWITHKDKVKTQPPRGRIRKRYRVQGKTTMNGSRSVYRHFMGHIKIVPGLKSSGH